MFYNKVKRDNNQISSVDLYLRHPQLEFEHQKGQAWTRENQKQTCTVVLSKKSTI